MTENRNPDWKSEKNGVCVKHLHSKSLHFKSLPAYFTVEAALLMPLVLGVLIGVLIIGFYLHDRACMQGAACESTAMAANLQIYDDQVKTVRKLGNTLLSSRLMWSRRVTGSCQAGARDASASFSGSFSVPGIIGQLWTDSGRSQVSGNWSRTIQEPARVIRRIRGARYLVEVLRNTN